MKILIVEDEDPKLRHVISFLEKMAADVVLSTARSVRSGLDAIEEQSPDIVILDMSLPTFDIGVDEGGGRPQGFGGRELIRTMELEGIAVPIIVLTGYDAFNKAGGQVGLDALNSELMSEHPMLFKGMLHFNSAYGDWEDRLRSLLVELGVKAR